MPGAGALPAEVRGLLGREQELAALTDRLTAPPTRLVTITGPPGVGKTRLAVAVAHALAGRFADGAAWVDLAPVRDPAAVPAEIGRALGRSVSGPGPRPGPTAVTDLEALVVLDNVEHLLAAAPAIGELIAGAPRLRFLATGRERLHLAAEREFPLPPLPTPGAEEVGDVARLRANPAVGVLLDHAPGGVALTPATAPALAEICVRLDGLPLALELAAARLRVFTPAELAFRLERRIAVLAAGPRDAPARHRDLRAAVAWSHDLLPERERAVFRRLAVFAGAWTVDAARAVCTDGDGEDAVDLIASLLEKHLVQRVAAPADPEAPARFVLLMSLREFAEERLRECGEEAATRDRHAAYYAAVAAGWERMISDGESAAWEALAVVRTDLVTALGHATGRRPSDELLWLAAGLGWYWYTRGHLSEAAPLRAALGALDPASAPDGAALDAEARTAALLAAGAVTCGLGDLDAAERYLSAAAELSALRGDGRRGAIAQAFLGHVARGRGQYELAAERHAAAAADFDRLGHRQGVAWAEHDLGLLALERDDHPVAAVHLRAALRLFREFEYDWAVAVCAWGLATALAGAGGRDEPAGLLAEALALHERVGDGRGIAQCLEAAAQLAAATGAAATGARLAGAAGAQRDAVGAGRSAGERARAVALATTVHQILGRAAAEHEERAGRTMPRPAARALAAEFLGRLAGPPDAATATDTRLTPRQSEVAALVAAGRTNRQIGRSLDISEKTAETHVRNIMERLGVPSRAGVAAWAATRGLTAPPDPD